MGRGILIFVFAIAACGRQTAPAPKPAESHAGDRQLEELAKRFEQAAPDRPPVAIGGGPAVPTSVPVQAARTEIARAWCALASGCGQGMNGTDACITRNEAELTDFGERCAAISQPRLDACLEAIRARACTDTSSPTACAEEDLCVKEK